MKGYWQLPHDLHGAILRRHDVSGEQLRVWLALGALTVGYGKPKDTIGAGQIADFCGVSRRNVHRALGALTRKGLAGARMTGPRRVERWIIPPADSVNGDTGGSVKHSVKADTRGSVKHSVKADTLQDSKKEDTPSTTARKVNVWGWWIDANRDAGRPEPLKAGPDLGAARELGRLVSVGNVSEDELRRCMALYLGDDDGFLRKTGHALRHLSGRINAYRAVMAANEPPTLDRAFVDDLERDAAEGSAT